VSLCTARDMSRKRVADAVIVGGGVIGCSLAYHLAREGLRVVLYERGELGAQSTGRCAGGVRQQFSTELNVRLQQISVRLLTQFQEEVGFPCDFRQIGYLMLLSTPAEVTSFREQLRMWHAVGLTEACWLLPEEAGRLAPAISLEGVLGATFCPTDGIASPNDVTHGYASAARQLGAELVTGTNIVGVEVRDHRVVGVRTKGGHIAAPLVLNCAGAWASELAAGVGVDLPVVPYRRHIFVSDSCPAVTRDSPMTVEVATSFYFHPDGNGVLFGMGEPDEVPTFATDVDWRLLERIHPIIERRVPALLESGIRSAWAGLYEVTPDHLPFLGPVGDPDGFWCACGFSGHGFQQAPAVGRLLTQMMLGRRPDLDLSPLSPTRDLAASVAEANVI
jgi:sarcosine oxidase, subunit beta